MTKLLEKVRVLENSEIASGYYKLLLRTEFPWKKIKPGQFGMLKCASGLDPFLRRPFSLWQRGANKISILYKIVGKGTKLLSQLRKGDETDLLGPLGNGFKIEKNFSKFLLVAGGSGAFSLIALIEELLKLNKEVYLLFGEKTKNLINFLENLWKEKIEVFFTTEDGSYGKKGKVSELLERKIICKKKGFDQIYSCGPMTMLEEVAQITKRAKIPCQISLEAMMACGFGVCLGCPVKTKNGLKLVCKDGPVFETEEVIFWNRT